MSAASLVALWEGKKGDPCHHFTLYRHLIKNQYFRMTGQSLFGNGGFTTFPGCAFPRCP